LKFKLAYIISEKEWGVNSINTSPISEIPINMVSTGHRNANSNILQAAT